MVRRMPVATEGSSLEGTFKLSYRFGFCLVEERSECYASVLFSV